MALTDRPRISNDF